MFFSKCFGASQPQPLPGAARSCLRSLRRCRASPGAGGRGGGGEAAGPPVLPVFFPRPPGDPELPDSSARLSPGTERLRRQTGLPPPPVPSCRCGHAGSPRPPSRPLTVGARRERPRAPRKRSSDTAARRPARAAWATRASRDPPAPPSPTCRPGSQGLATTLVRRCGYLRFSTW